MSDGAGYVLGLVVVGLVCLVGLGGCISYPHYKVYTQRLEGEALLKRAESERQVQIEDAKGKEQAAKMLAGAEVERAKGVSEANRIIGDSLRNNPEYLTYLWIKEVNADGNAVIYIPTEAGLPILEAGRTIGKKTPPAPPEPKK
jgi:regulator of protease activity HflC (stomatin/prohibitin superfamily)